MSWYNNQNEGFIDATQELQSGGVSQVVLDDITDDLTELKEVFKPKVLDIQNASLDTIIVNNTANSRIFLQNNNIEPKIKVEGGKLYLYYDYDFTNAPTIPAGWTDILAYAIANRQTLLTQAVDLIAINTYLFSPLPLNLQSRLTAIDEEILLNSGLIASLQTRTFNLEGEVAQLIARYYFQRGGAVMPDNTDGITNMAEAMNTVRERLRIGRQDYINFCNSLTGDIAGQAGQQAVAIANLSRTTLEILEAGAVFAYELFQNVFIGFGIAGVALTWWYLDSQKDRINTEKEAKLIITYEKLLTNESSNNIDTIHLAGLAIYGGNNLLGNDGTYTPTISNGGKLEIKIINGSAVITRVIDIGTPTLNVGQIISIPKTALGGVNTGTLDIQVTSLISARQAIRDALEATKTERETLQNRRRLREGVINKNEFGDGLTIAYNSSITNTETGEVLQVPTIKLNLNSAQLETINGVLNIKKYVNQDDIDIINGNIDVIDGEIVDINQSLERVYKVILPTGQTMTSDYKLNLGYKEIFTGFPYDLIMLAIKKETYTTFSSANYNYDYLGYFPNMNRLSQLGDIKVISDATITINASQHFTKGFIYMKNTNELKSFNLNRKFEFVSFLKFVSFNNNVTDYHLIQTAVDLGQGFIEIDYTKFSLYIRNRRFKIKHPAVVEYQIYTPSNNNNITNKLITPNTYVILEPYTIGGTIYNDNIRIGEQYIAGNPNDFQYDLRMINVPYKINNNTPYINTPTGLIKSVNSNDTSTPTNDSRYIQMYLNHPSNPNTSYANCIFPTIQYSIGMTQAGVVASTPTWHIQKIVLVFDILFHIMIDTNPPGFVENPPPYIPFPSIQQYEKAETNSTIDFTFRLRYSFDGITYTTHNFTMNDVVGEPVYDTPFNYVDTGFYGNDIRLKQRWTYTFNIPTTYPIYGNKVRFVDFTLVRKPNFPYHSSYASGTATTAYHNQAMLHLYELKLTEYETSLNPNMIQTTAINYETTDENTPLIGLSSTPWYLFNLQMDLQNDYISYFINDTFYEITSRAPIKLYPSDIVMPDSTIPFITASFLRWGNLTLDNSLLVIGNLPSTGSINFTHFNWRYFQSNETFLTLVQYQKLKELINYIYYYDYVSVDKLLDTNEISANNIITRQLIINNNPIISSLTSTTRSRDLRTNQTQEVANVLIPLTNLYVINPIKSGTIFYNFLTKSFTIGTGTRSEEEDDALLELIGTTAGFGLQWDATTNKLDVIPEDLYQDLTPVYTQIETTSNILLADFVARDAVLDTKINTNDLNVSNYVRTTSNYLKGVIDSIPIYDDTALTTLVNTNDLNVSNYVRTTSNYLKGVIDGIPIYDDTALTTLVNTNDLNVSNYVRTTSNYLKGVIDGIPIYDDTALTALVNTNDLNVSNYVRTTSNFLQEKINAIPGSKWTDNSGTIYATDLGSNVVIGQVQTGTTGSKFKVYPNSGQNACFFNGTISLGTGSSSSLFWNSFNDTFIGRANTIGFYSSSSVVGDLVISSDKNIIIKTGISTATPSIYVKEIDGNVGIGKNNPSYKLDVSGNINCSEILVNGSSLTALVNTNDLNISNYVRTTSNILLTDFVARDAVLNTAITTNAYSDTKVSTYLGDTTTKTIGGTLQVGTSTGGGIIQLGGITDDTGFDLATIQNRQYTTSKSEIVIFKGNDIEGTSGADRIRLRAGAIAFDTFSTASTSATTESIRMYITGGGNVGIGTTTPDNLLTIRTTATTAILRIVSSSATGNAFIRFMKSDGNSLGYDIGYEGTTTNNLQFIAYNSTTTGRVDMQIARSTGNVGIGTLPSATFKLNVNGGINATSLSINNNAIIQSQWTTSGTRIYYNTGNVTIGTTTNSSDDGNINITTPDSTLYVRGAATAGSQTNITFRGGLEGNSNGKVRIWLLNDAAHSSYIQSEHTGNGNTHLTFGTANGNFLPTEKMKISNDGRVDINNRLVMTGTDPTIIFKDTDQRSGFIHMNSSVMYFLNGSGVASETWQQQNGQNWPLQLNMDNNRATFGGVVTTPAISTSTIYDFSGTYLKMVFGAGYTEFYGTSATSTNNFIYAGNGYAYFSSASTNFVDLVAKFNGSTWTTSWIGASSSIKIKQDIEELDDSECLNKLLQLRPVKYRYIDITKNFDATKKVYGFIAESVKEVFPEAVNDKNSELIPNIYLMASAEGDILTIAKELELNIEYTCYLSDKTEKIIVLEDLGDGRYKINKTYEIRTDIFVYGKIDDQFHILKKEYLHAVTISSVQEHHKIIMEQKQKITALEERLAKIEAVLSDMLNVST